MLTGPPSTLFDKIWASHVVRPETAETPAVLYVDLHLVHEVTSPQAFALLREQGLVVRRPENTVATTDHSTPTTRSDDGMFRFVDHLTEHQVGKLAENCAEFGVELYAQDDPRQGIVHVIGPELGLTRPGRTIVCGDSHTSTHGAFGALAFGIGTTEVGHVLATQCLLQRRPRTMRIRVDGQLDPGVTAKDVVLAIIARIGVGGATGHVIEYAGAAIRAMSMEERMTVCSMSIEAGAKAGLIAPDEATMEYVSGRPLAPHGREWDLAAHVWSELRSDPEAVFDKELTLVAAGIAPMVTYGTNPGMGIPVDAAVPDRPGDAAHERALEYMGLEPGRPLIGHPVDVVFVGSCTNSRISDLRAVAGVLDGRRIDPGVRMLVVPGSSQVKSQAEAEGIDEIVRNAGAEWREAGCSMCIAMNGDQLDPGQYCVSTSNRNFEGRQGRGSRTFLASPLTAAASAVAGAIADPRECVR